MSIMRDIGFYTLSKGTSLALEGLTHTGEYSDREGTAPLEAVKSIWLNVRTIYRNAYSSVPTEHQSNLDLKQVIDFVEEDIAGFIDCMSLLNPDIEIKPYVCTYNTVSKSLKHCRFKESTTPKQEQFEALQRDLVKYYISTYGDNEEELTVFDWKLSGRGEVHVLTHLLIDLLSYKHFTKLTLLESNTGKVKDKKDWNTRLSISQKEDRLCLPFNAATLQIFGDGSIIQPQELKVRRVLLAIAKKRGWNAATTIAKMIHDCKLEYEPNLASLIQRYNIRI